MRVNLLEGNVTKSMLLFSIPMILGNLLQQLYNIADTLIVGRFIGADALAARVMVKAPTGVARYAMGSGGWDASLYRSCCLPLGDGGFGLWYSAWGPERGWRLGFTRFSPQPGMSN